MTDQPAMTDQPVRWGILATDTIAHAFVEDLRLMPGAEVLAVGSRAQVTADVFAQRYEIPRAYGDWDSLAADADLDVIYVATPHSAHHDATMRCLRAGRAVLCEKPLTLDEPSSRDLVETAKAAGLFLMEAMWARCNPAIRRMQALLREGAIGEVTSVHANFGLAGPFSPRHRLRDPALGGGALLDLGIYPITLAHVVFGRPDTITAWASLTPERVDQQTAMIFGYEAGGVALLSCGLVGATGATAIVTGQDGRIELPGPFFRPSRFTLHRRDAEPEVIKEPLAGHGYLPEIAEVHRCLREGLTESPLVPHATTLEMMSIMDEVREQIGVSYT